MFLSESVEVGSTVLSPFFDWLMAQLYAIASIRTPFLTALFSGLTYLGHEMGFLVVAMILLWCTKKKYGYRLLIIFMFGTFVQQILKNAFMIARPWVMDPAFDPFVVQSAKAAATGFSFPSGHTTTACLALGSIAIYLRKNWAYIGAIVLTLLVAFSRMYLGVHTLLDVSVGFLIGVVLLAAFSVLFERHENSDAFVNAFTCIGVALGAILVAYLLLKPIASDADESVALTRTQALKDAVKLFGASVGMLIGKWIDDRFVHFETETPLWKQFLKVALGFVIVVAIWFGLKKVFPPKPVFDGIRYFAMSFVGIGIYPILFKKLFRPGKKAA